MQLEWKKPGIILMFSFSLFLNPAFSQTYNTIQILNEEAVFLFKDGKYEESLEKSNAVLLLEPNNFSA